MPPLGPVHASPVWRANMPVLVLRLSALIVRRVWWENLWGQLRRQRAVLQGAVWVHTPMLSLEHQLVFRALLENTLPVRGHFPTPFALIVP